MLNAIAKAMMMDTQNIIAAYFGSNRQLRKDAIAEASDRFRTIITSLSTASNELEGTARSLSDSADNTTRLATVVANASEDASNNVQSVASADRRTRRFGPRDFGAGSGIQPHRRQRRATGG